MPDSVVLSRSEVVKFCAEVLFELGGLRAGLADIADNEFADEVCDIIYKVDNQTREWNNIDAPPGKGGIPASIAVAVHPSGAWKAVGEGDIDGVQDYEQAVADAAELMHDGLLTECQFFQVNVVLPAVERSRLTGFIATF